MFGKVLIANRGEIAVRVAQGLREMGITSIAVYSEPDRAAPHVGAADEAAPLAGATPAETYLDAGAVLDAAVARGAEAVHPGYGFLSENPRFARACAERGLVFIGPAPGTIEAMADKVLARRRMEEAGVPVVPGAAPNDAGELAARASELGYPVLVKATAGGGGRGMRRVEVPEALAAAVESARREAAAAFGDDRLFVEKFIARARHVEVQILGDMHGNVVHLFERECSIQRRHQKIIEEAPAPGLDGDLRRQMTGAAVRAARAIAYAGAGTVEFMVDEREAAFYFLEVNTRLQVEHPLTEALTRRDLVHAQVHVAAGEPLSFGQDQVRPEGHAIECRVYAEDPGAGFRPSTGVIEVYEPPVGPGIRVDSGIAAGSEVTVHYDALLAKLITGGATRADAIARMNHALERFVILGVTTNIDFLHRVIDHDAFRAGALHTRFIEEHAPALEGPGPAPDEALIAAALAGSGGPGRRPGGGAETEAADPWRSGGAWRAR